MLPKTIININADKATTRTSLLLASKRHEKMPETARKSQTPPKHLDPPATALAGVSPTLKIHRHAAWQARR
jgi:hypothetical protein